MTAQKIQSQEEYDRAVKKLEELKRTNPNSAEVQELSQSIEQYTQQQGQGQQGQGQQGQGRPQQGQSGSNNPTR